MEPEIEAKITGIYSFNLFLTDYLYQSEVQENRVKREISFLKSKWLQKLTYLVHRNIFLLSILRITNTESTTHQVGRQCKQILAISLYRDLGLLFPTV